LDVQYIIGVANQIPLTFWSIASSDNTPFYDWIVAVSNTAYPPLVHSMSYGGQENGNSKSLMDSTNTEFMKMGVRGLTIMISSGDDGAAGSGARGNSANCGFNPSWPATSPYILAVGATQFQGGSATGAQIPCQSNNVPASLITTGGGFSSVFAAPSYQTSAISAYLSSGVAIPNQVSQATAFTYPAPGFWAGGRGYPDVAALGHNYQVAINGYLYVLDGTSASAPVTAGMIALLNNKRLNAGQAPMGFINPFLYNLATTNPGVFHDATTGNNGCTASTTCCTGFNAAAGWDPVNGLGAFDFSKLITHV
jgi:tripeptidyl-peptidase-1